MACGGHAGGARDPDMDRACRRELGLIHTLGAQAPVWRGAGYYCNLSCGLDCFGFLV